MRRSREALAAGAAGALVLCGLALAVFFSALPVSLRAHDRITTKVTWTREISPIFDARCVGCHRAGGSSSIPLTTYPDARPWAAAIREEVLTRRMPKWNAARGYGDFANDPSLSPFEIALIAAWVDGGAPENVGRNQPAAAATMPKTPAPRAFSPPGTAQTRTATHGCGSLPIAGRLLAVRPTLAKGASAGLAAVLPGGRQEIVAWIRDYDPTFAPTYWLRAPLVLPAGSRLLVEGTEPCAVAVTLAR